MHLLAKIPDGPEFCHNIYISKINSKGIIAKFISLLKPCFKGIFVPEKKVTSGSTKQLELANQTFEPISPQAWRDQITG